MFLYMDVFQDWTSFFDGSLVGEQGLHDNKEISSRIFFFGKYCKLSFQHEKLLPKFLVTAQFSVAGLKKKA